MPTALLSRVDADRQWLQSCVGLDAQQADRAVTFCDRALRSPGPLVVPDARTDQRFAADPRVAGPPHARFVAGVPLRTPGGHPLGALCLLAPDPRTFGPADRAALADLAVLAADELGRRLGAADRGRAEERLRLLKSVVAHANDAVLITDAEPVEAPDGPRIRYVEPAGPGSLRQLVGVGAGEPPDEPREGDAHRQLGLLDAVSIALRRQSLPLVLPPRHGPGPPAVIKHRPRRIVQRQGAGRTVEPGAVRHAAGGTGADLAVAAGVQRGPPAQLTGLPAAGPRGSTHPAADGTAEPTNRRRGVTSAVVSIRGGRLGVPLRAGSASHGD